MRTAAPAQAGRRLSGLALFVLAACGGTSSSQPTTMTTTAGGGGAGGGAVAGSPTDICNRLYELRDGLKCDFAKGFDLTPAECTAEFQKALEDRGAEARKATQMASACFAEPTCDAVSNCMAKMPSPTKPEQALRKCKEPDASLGSAAVGYPRSEWERRKGASSVHYGDVPTTKESPIEVCEIPAEMEWLLRVTCADGSRPFRSYDHAHAARVGNVGAGGRCNAIIDLYEVPCPEKTYQIYIDAYSCPMEPI